MNGDDDPILEDLLRQVKVAEPSSRLDVRIQRLVQPPPRRWTSLAMGFAAGVMVTVSAGLLVSHFTVVPAAPLVQPVVHPQKPESNEVHSQPATVTMWADPREVVDEINGEIDGVPIRLERTRRQTVLWRTSDSPESGPAAVVLPEVVTVRPMPRF